MPVESLDEVRATAAWVAEVSSHVRIDHARLARYAASLAGDGWEQPGLDPLDRFAGDPDTAVAFAVTMGAISFGSGWHPVLRKRHGLSGTLTVASGLRERFEAGGPLSADELVAMSAPACAALFGQDPADGGAGELMALFARSLRELGRFLADRFDGSTAALVAAAGGSAEALALLLAAQPAYEDVTAYRGRIVPFLKRAQLTASDVARALEGVPGRALGDRHRLTAFADNLVPHVLRVDGVLVYAPRLSGRIGEGRLLPPGAPEECEIRAACVHAVELLTALLRDAGRPCTAAELDGLLWKRGQQAAYKALPRHRTRTTAY